jgi:hypothetical protein
MSTQQAVAQGRRPLNSRPSDAGSRSTDDNHYTLTAVPAAALAAATTVGGGVAAAGCSTQQLSLHRPADVGYTSGDLKPHRLHCSSPAMSPVAAAAASPAATDEPSISGQNSSQQQYSGGDSRSLQHFIRKGKPRGRSGPKSRFSPFIGVSQYKRTGRWEVT